MQRRQRPANAIEIRTNPNPDQNGRWHDGLILAGSGKDWHQELSGSIHDRGKKLYLKMHQKA
jgi:hypothetical protein